jgi:GntR family transcriptional regulator, transcriptional repressor for pyruvate dehydrogenase complex
MGWNTLTFARGRRYGGRVVGPPEFGTVTREAVPQQIVSRLLDLIQQRHLGPGDRLPAERELSATMGVSRSSLREALRALTVLGVTEMRHGTGTYVSSLSPDLLVRPLSFVLSLSDGGFEQLFEARKVVEPAMAALAAQRIDGAALDHIEALADRAGDALDDEQAFMAADLELHDAIRVAAGNAILGRFMESIAALGLASRKVTNPSSAVRRQSLEDHKRIAEALRSQDGEAAAAAMRRHIENVEEEAKP